VCVCIQEWSYTSRTSARSLVPTPWPIGTCKCLPGGLGTELEGAGRAQEAQRCMSVCTYVMYVCHVCMPCMYVMYVCQVCTCAYVYVCMCACMYVCTAVCCPCRMPSNARSLRATSKWRAAQQKKLKRLFAIVVAIAMVASVTAWPSLSLLMASLVSVSLLLLARCMSPRDAREAINIEIVLSIASAFGPHRPPPTTILPPSLPPPSFPLSLFCSLSPLQPVSPPVSQTALSSPPSSQE